MLELQFGSAHSFGLIEFNGCHQVLLFLYRFRYGISQYGCTGSVLISRHGPYLLVGIPSEEAQFLPFRPVVVFLGSPCGGNILHFLVIHLIGCTGGVGVDGYGKGVHVCRRVDLRAACQGLALAGKSVRFFGLQVDAFPALSAFQFHRVEVPRGGSGPAAVRPRLRFLAVHAHDKGQAVTGQARVTVSVHIVRTGGERHQCDERYAHQSFS